MEYSGNVQRLYGLGDGISYVYKIPNYSQVEAIQPVTPKNGGNLFSSGKESEHFEKRFSKAMESVQNQTYSKGSIIDFRC